MNPDRYAAIKRIFLEALDLEPADRSALVQERCGDDRQLIQEVEALLAHNSSQTILPTTPPDRQTGSDTRSNQSANTRPGNSVPGGARRTPRVPVLGRNGQLAMGAALAAILLAAFGWWQKGAVNNAIRNTLDQRLNASIDAHVESFNHWVRFQNRTVQSWVRDREFRSLVTRLAKLESPDSDAYAVQLRQAPEQELIREDLVTHGGPDTQYAIFNLRQLLIAESPPPGHGLGSMATSRATARLAAAFRGETVMFIDKIGNLMHDQFPVPETDTDIFVATPLHNDDNQIVAVLLLFNIDTALLEKTVRSISRITRTSETYAFDGEGRMLSESRFNDQLRATGILSPDTETSSLHVILRDPGGDLVNGYQMEKTLLSRPLTHMARHAIAGENGFDVDGYRNYLGNTVVGAWRWLPEHEFGFAMEVDRDEAYEPMGYVERQFVLSFLLLAVSVIGIVLSSWWISRLRHQIGIDRRLGQYTLVKLIGEGGMGQVYEARHQLLKRPCAIKVLKPDLSNPRMLAWFEREVQSASQLSHPNTIRIFDYGTTPEGNFYYVMELLQGVDLEKLSRNFGALPWPRAVYMLRQACRSLNESHMHGYVHRDIKPQNIFVCRLGGEFDFIKVLDFGLAKQFQADYATVTGSVAGTPLYMPPERWRYPDQDDPRSDIYSLGAVAYRLVTGQEIFVGNNPADLLDQILTNDIVPPRERGIDLPDELNQLIMECLAGDMDQRPASVRAVYRRLEALQDLKRWNQEDSRKWWERYGDIPAGNEQAV